MVRQHRPRRRPHLAVSAIDDGESHAASLADVVERMFARFESDLNLSEIVTVVRRCARELDILSGRPEPHAVESLACRRLEQLAAAKMTGS